VSRTFVARNCLHRGPRLVFRLSTPTLADAILHKMHFASVRSSFGSMGKEVSLARILCTYGLFLSLGKAMWPENESGLEDFGNEHQPRDFPLLQIAGVRHESSCDFFVNYRVKARRFSNTNGVQLRVGIHGGISFNNRFLNNETRFWLIAKGVVMACHGSRKILHALLLQNH
jgi:hypothetical protein